MSSFSAEEIQVIISDIVLGFSTIDDEVMELNDVSNQDFSALNAIFKDHYKTSRAISDSIADVLTQAQNLSDDAAFVKMQSVVVEAQRFLTLTNDTIEEFYGEVSSLNTDFKHVFIPVLNFKQNVSTLRFLLTNLKLNQGLVDGVANPERDSLVDKLNQKISEIQSELPIIADDIEHLKVLYSRMKQMLMLFMNDSIPYFSKICSLLAEMVQHVGNVFSRAKFIQNKISQKSKQGFDSLNMVITNLQYHDIIRQKIEHIQITQRNILDELNGFEKEQKIIQKGFEYLKQIPGITEIQAGQLLLSNKEYQNAIENSSTKLIDSAKTLDELIALAGSIFDGAKVPDLAADMRLAGESFNQSAQTLKVDFLQLKMLNGEIQQHIEQQIEQYNKLSNMENEVSQIILDINKDISPKNEINAIASKLDSLRNDIKESKVQMGKILEVHQGNSLNVYSDTLVDEINTVYSNLVQSNELCTFAELLTQIDIQISNNYDVYLTLDNQLKTTLGGIRYYDYYDVAVEKIIQQLNLIYRKIQPMTASGESGGDLIAAMEKAYTMQSQRDIHDQKEQDAPDADTDDDNLELF